MAPRSDARRGLVRRFRAHPALFLATIASFALAAPCAATVIVSLYAAHRPPLAARELLRFVFGLMCGQRDTLKRDFRADLLVPNLRVVATRSIDHIGVHYARRGLVPSTWTLKQL